MNENNNITINKLYQLIYSDTLINYTVLFRGLRRTYTTFKLLIRRISQRGPAYIYIHYTYIIYIYTSTPNI